MKASANVNFEKIEKAGKNRTIDYEYLASKKKLNKTKRIKKNR